MPNPFRIVAVQAKPVSLHESRTGLASDVEAVLAANPGVNLLAYPELHLFHAPAASDEDRVAEIRASAITLDNPLIAEFAQVARNNGIWFVPGSIVEKGEGNHIYNTALVFNPDGELVATYRKIFPWRPFEPYTPGTEFVVFDIPAVGRFGISICYDAWFPEVSRQLAWLGADIVLNLVKTTTPDRAQEVVLARANSIVNQTYTVSVNTAGPVGFGHSIAVGPEGEVLDEVVGVGEGVIVTDFSRQHADHVREVGTAGTNRMWDQFRQDDPQIPLPLYAGRIDPKTWAPARKQP